MQVADVGVRSGLLLPPCAHSEAHLQVRSASSTAHQSSVYTPHISRRGISACHPLLYEHKAQRHTRCCGTAAPEQPASIQQAAPGDWTSGIAADILIADATNIACGAAADARVYRHVGTDLPVWFAAWLDFLRALVQPAVCFAVFDAPKGTAVNRKQASLPTYLQRRRRRDGDAAGGLLAPESLRRPQLQAVAEAAGFTVAVAADGWEADDIVGALCAAATAGADAGDRQPQAIVASGDSDFAGLLDAQVSWLQLQHQPSPSCPSSCRLVTAAGFLAAAGYSPHQHSDFLALAGKPEANVPGVGLGSAAAKKLLHKFGSIGGILEAARAGALACWGPNTRRALGPEVLLATERQLQANLAAVSLCRNPSLLDATTRAAVAAFSLGEPDAAQIAARLPAGGNVAADGERASQAAALAWLHPWNAVRRQHVEPHMHAVSAALAASGVHYQTFYALPSGLVMDIAVFPAAEQRSAPSVASSPAGMALMLRTKYDLKAAAPTPGTVPAFKHRLNGRARQHSGLLRRKNWTVVDCDCTSGSSVKWALDAVLGSPGEDALLAR